MKISDNVALLPSSWLRFLWVYLTLVCPVLHSYCMYWLINVRAALWVTISIFYSKCKSIYNISSSTTHPGQVYSNSMMAAWVQDFLCYQLHHSPRTDDAAFDCADSMDANPFAMFWINKMPTRAPLLSVHSKFLHRRLVSASPFAYRAGIERPFSSGTMT